MTAQFAEYEPPMWLTSLVDGALDGSGITAWIPTGSAATSAMVRVPRFPRSIPDGTLDDPLELDVLRNGSQPFQLAVVSDRPIQGLRCRISELESDDGTSLSGEHVDVRFVGYVPVARALSEPDGLQSIEELAGEGLSGDRTPDLIGDPLLSRPSIDVDAHRAQPIWLTVEVPASVPAGTCQGTVTIEAADIEPIAVPLELTVEDLTLPAPADYEFHLDVWLNPDAVAVEAGVERWSDAHWRRLESYFDSLAAAGQGMIAAAVVHQPWRRPWPDGRHRPQTATGFHSLVKWQYDGDWTFGFDRFDRFVELALDRGVGPEIAAFSMLQFRDPQRLTYDDGSGERVVESIETGDERWREGWTAFLDAFANHLDEQGWLEQTWLAFDERPPDLMAEAIDLIESAAPVFEDRIQIAGSETVESLADDFSVIVNDLPLPDDRLESRRQANRRTTCYTSVGIVHPNTFTISPLVEARQLPWFVADHGLDGFLRWAFNSWPRDVYRHPVHRFMQGDEYFVYPGETGPVPSVRWRQLVAGIEEYELLARLRSRQPSLADELASRAASLDGDDAPKVVGSARRDLIDALVG